MDKIIDSIYLGIVSGYRTSTDISILTGSSGKILFLGYLYHSTKNKEVLSGLEEIISYTIDLINDNDLCQRDFTYGGGITGFYWVVNHLYRKNLLFEDSATLKNILNKETEERIVESLQMDFLLSRYDPLYGYIGKGLYFLSKPESTFSKSVIESILRVLSRDKVKVDQERITWVDFRLRYENDHAENERFVLGNCGQAHGITGIISFLCTVIEKCRSKRLKNIAAGLLRPATAWLLSQEIPPAERDLYFFPQSVNLLDGSYRASRFSRLGWCYGDHVIAYTLYRVAAALNEEKYQFKADEITLSSCRIPLERSGVTDQADQKQFNPTICHGAAGIAHIYERIYQYNTTPQVAEACQFWNDITRNYTERYLKTGQLLSLSDNSQEAFDLLYGYAGIGLYLIAGVYSNYGWDSCILLD
jgi:lantibiotic modifying enzyme